jgi:hypothetical protein
MELCNRSFARGLSTAILDPDKRGRSADLTTCVPLGPEVTFRGVMMDDLTPPLYRDDGVIRSEI